jgi:hypothetical protein
MESCSQTSQLNQALIANEYRRIADTPPECSAVDQELQCIDKGHALRQGNSCDQEDAIHQVCQGFREKKKKSVQVLYFIF